MTVIAKLLHLFVFDLLLLESSPNGVVKILGAVFSLADILFVNRQLNDFIGNLWLPFVMLEKSILILLMQYFTFVEAEVDVMHLVFCVHPIFKPVMVVPHGQVVRYLMEIVETFLHRFHSRETWIQNLRSLEISAATLML